MLIIDKIGIKSIKIALAVTMSLLIGNLFKLGSPHLIALTSIIGIQNTMESSVSNARDLIIGTFIGVLVGIITVTFLPKDFIIIAIGVFLIIYICNLLELKSSIVQANLIYLSVMLFPSPNYNAVSVTISTVVGVIVAIIIDFILSPFEIINNLHKSYHELRKDIFSLCSNVFTTNKDVELQDFDLKVMSFKSLMKAYNNEYFKVKYKKLEFNQIDILFKNINGIRFFIHAIIELKENNLSEDNVIRINKLLNLNIKVLDYKENQGDKLFNFHVDKFLNYLERIVEIKVSS